jgi:hypothetical protein
MKTSLLLRVALSLSLLLFSTTTRAQGRPAAPTAGYWNIETNLATRTHTIVRFYNDQNQLVYEEQLPTLCLDLSRNTGLCRRTTAQLNLALQQVLRDPAAASQTPTLLALQFGPNRRLQRAYAVR